MYFQTKNHMVAALMLMPSIHTDILSLLKISPKLYEEQKSTEIEFLTFLTVGVYHKSHLLSV